MRANELLSLWMRRTDGAQCCALLGKGVACADIRGDLWIWITTVLGSLLVINLTGFAWVAMQKARKASVSMTSILTGFAWVAMHKARRATLISPRLHVMRVFLFPANVLAKPFLH